MAGGEWSDAGERALAERCGPEQIRDGLQELDALDRASFLLREVERLPLEEAAAVLGIPPASIRQRVHRATLILTAFLRSTDTRPQQRA